MRKKVISRPIIGLSIRLGNHIIYLELNSRVGQLRPSPLYDKIPKGLGRLSMAASRNYLGIDVV